jgi:hypothetical protein
MNQHFYAGFIKRASEHEKTALLGVLSTMAKATKPLLKVLGGGSVGWGVANAAFGAADARNSYKALNAASRSGQDAASIAAAGRRSVGA